ncbi:3-oxoacyl-[acyl-carrier-protein] synthase 2 [Clostridia bacterium]|nr:3-oxoacyl-[acyl-carrier-protein] synthase 2 [Clostridia bacterium]
MKRVVITGMGTVNPLGNNVNEFWDNIRANKHGFSYISTFDPTDLGVKIIGEVKNFSPENVISAKEFKRMERFLQLAVVAAKEALIDGGLDFSETEIENPYRKGVIVGCGTGGINLIEDEYSKYLSKGPSRVSVFFIPMMIINMAAGEIAMRSKFKGANFAPVTACASATHAIGEAFEKIKYGQLDMCLCGGTESSMSEFTLAGFANMKALSKSTNLDRASIPFDKERNGFILSEGAGILLLEEYEHAKARGAKIYAEVSGYGTTCDAYHMTSPSPTGESAATAMRLALGDIPVENLTYINAHGTSTSLNDKYETTAIKVAFGEHAKKIKINSTKSMTGHLLGAAGAVEAIVTALSIKNSLIHKTVGYVVPDEECDLDYCVNGNVETQINAAISNSLGFGGHNASICLTKVEV